LNHRVVHSSDKIDSLKNEACALVYWSLIITAAMGSFILSSC